MTIGAAQFSDASSRPGHWSRQSGTLSPSESVVSSSPHPQMPGSILLGSIGQPSHSSRSPSLSASGASQVKPTNVPPEPRQSDSAAMLQAVPRQHAPGSNRQFSSQPSSGSVFPSSHDSPPMFRIPSPQTFGVHSFRQESCGSLLPSSHSSPAVALSVPSPQLASVQSTSHMTDSPAWSHSSVPIMQPSPQTGASESSGMPLPLQSPGN